MAITISLMGGLGNQMFQYAYGRALIRRGKQVYFSRAQCPATHPEPHKSYSLDGFKVFVPCWDHPAGAPLYEKGLPYDEAMMNPPEPSIIYGYFQSEKYFCEIEPIIREEFQLYRDLSATAWQYSQSIETTNSIALHVRRKDYLTLTAIHGMMGMDYYTKALQIIYANHPGPTSLFIFSDDPQWCAKNMPGIVVNTGNKFEDLYLFSLCKHAVIVNSSFSWWGAWLNPDKHRTVIAPKKWFVDPSLDDRDIVPERWIKI
jgi:hypothetical protein